jgi:Peptidase_C39 like family
MACGLLLVSMLSTKTLLVLSFSIFAWSQQGCAAPASEGAEPTKESLAPEADGEMPEGDELTGNYPVGTKFVVIKKANHRSQPSLQAGVLQVIEKGEVVVSASTTTRSADGLTWYGATYRGKTGWIAGSLLDRPPTSTQLSNPPASKPTSGGGKVVPYECQYTNGIDDGAAYGANTCATTSTSMALRYFGVNLNALDYYRAYRNAGYDYNDAKDFPTVTRILEKIPATRGKFVTRTLGSGQGGTTADLKKALDEGFLVVVGANLFGGHVVLVTGYDDKGVYVNDPAGIWNPSLGNKGSAYNKCSGSSNNAKNDLISWESYRSANVFCTESGRAINQCPNYADLWMLAIKAK